METLKQDFAFPVVGIFIDDVFYVVPVLHRTYNRAVILHDHKIYNTVNTNMCITAGLSYPLYKLESTTHLDLSEV